MEKKFKVLLSPFIICVLLYIIRYFPYIRNTNWIYCAVDTNGLLTKLMKIQSCKNSDIIPYWINNIGGGVGLTDRITSAFFDYPLFLTSHLPYVPGLIGLRSLTIVALLHIFLNLVNIIILSKVLRFSTWASIAMGSLFLLLVNSEACARWTTIPCAYSWFPLLLAGLIQLVTKPNSKLGIILIVISVWGFTVNPLQPFISTIIFSILFIITWILFSFRNFVSNIPALLLTAILSALIMAVAVIPGTLNSSTMLRIVDGNLIKGNAKVTFDEQMSFIYDSSKLKYIIDIPKDFYLGFPVGHPYLNLILVLITLGSTYLIFRFTKSSLKDNPRWIYIMLLITSCYLLFSVFDQTYITTKINASIPLLDKVRQPLRNAFIFQSGFLVIAGYFIDYVCKSKANSKSRIYLQFGLILSSAFYAYTFSNFWIFLSTLILLVLYIFLKNINIVFLQLVLLISIILILNPHPFDVDKGLIKRNINDYEQKSFTLSAISQDIDYKNYRIKYDFKQYNPWAQIGSYYGLRTIQGGVHPYIIPQYYEMNWVTHPNYSSLIGQRYRLSDKTNSKKYERTIGQYGKYYLFENNTALPYSYISNNVSLITINGHFKWNQQFKIASFSEQILGGTLYLRDEIFNKIKVKLKPSIPFLDKSVNIEHINQNQKLISVNTKQSSILVINEYFNKNWTATINGDTTHLFKVNLNQIGMYLPAGDHKITFEYKSILTYKLLLLHRLGLILLALLLCYTLYERFIKNTALAYQQDM